MATMKIIVVLAAAFLFVNAEEAKKADEKADAKSVQYSYSVSKPVVVSHQVVTGGHFVSGGSQTIVTHTTTHHVGSAIHHVEQKPAPKPVLHVSPPKPSLVAYVVNSKINCWNGCGARGGPCPKVCGSGGQCCRRGWKGCPSDMSKVATPNYHTCIRYRARLVAYVVNSKINCWNGCGSRGGPCPKVCGSGGQCCRRGWKGCPSDMSKVATPNYHTCIRYRGPLGAGGCKVQLFQHSNYGGVENVYTADTIRVKRNDDMSSLKVGGGCCVITFEHYGYGGRSQKYCRNTKFVGKWWNDKVSSIKVVKGPLRGGCSATLFQHSNYGGVKNVYTRSGPVKRNDDMSSLKVGAGCCVITYEHYGYKGKSQKYCKDTKFVGGWWNDKVSSIKVVMAAYKDEVKQVEKDEEVEKDEQVEKDEEVDEDEDEAEEE